MLKPTELMSSFAYRSLCAGKQTIRLIHVLPGQGCALQDHEAPAARLPISCTISHVSLDEAPAYTALSYAWGNATRSCEILLDGVIFHVTENLDLALRHLRPRDEALNLWVDALCINQNDDEEKSEQLELMRRIYCQASSVVAWLGPVADDSDVAMQWIEHYGGRACELGLGTKPELQLRNLLELLESGRKGFIAAELEAFLEGLKVKLSPANLEHSRVLASLFKFLQRPYWSRIWVVQELRSASTILFVCGNKTVTENALHHALRLLRNFRLYQILKCGRETSAIKSSGISMSSIDPRYPITLLKTRRRARPSPLLYLLRNLRIFKSTDPRDKMFALLGIAADTKALGLRPDYRKSCQEVYTDLARALIYHGYLDILSHCEGPTHIRELPSWVCDWSCGSLRSPLQQRSPDGSIQSPVRAVFEPHFAASGLTHTTSLDDGHKIPWTMPLLLPAVLVGEVQQVGAVWEGERFGRWLQDLERFSQPITSTSQMCNTNTCSSNRSRTNEREQAIWRTAVADQEIRKGVTKPRLSKEKIDIIHVALSGKDLALVDEKMLVSAGLGDYCQQLRSTARSRRPILVSGGFLGIGPGEAETGDLVYVLMGAGVPYVMRQCGQGGKVKLVGEAYVHGIMDGEAVDGREIETITIF